MIRFRCWKCHRKHAKLDEKIGKTFTCSCESLLRIPKRDDGNCRVKTIADRVVEAVVCGGGGALLGFCLALFIVSRSFFRDYYTTAYLISGLTIGCGLIGFLAGERGIDWIGERIRERERD